MFIKLINLLIYPLIILGRWSISIFIHIGALAFFAFKAIRGLFSLPFYGKVFFNVIFDIGYLSLPVVALTSFFAGGVVALQSYIGLGQFHSANMIAHVVLLAIVRELGPVLTGLMIAGRVGAAMAARIGSMRITNQIDALKMLSTNPIKYLVTPRLFAAFLALPFLVIISDIIGVMGGACVGITKMGFLPQIYMHATLASINITEFFEGLIKAAVFGFIIALIGCYNGYYADKGAEGVGRAATSSVVTASIMILIFDYLLTDIFLMGL